MSARHAAAAGPSRLLFIGPLPDPITGQSLACQVLLDEIRLHQPVEVINLSKDGFVQGMSSLHRVQQVMGIVWCAWRAQRHADLIYFTIAESYAGNAKDLLIYLVCFRRLRRMMIHLHGGAGLRNIMAEGPRLWRGLNAFFLRRIGSVIILGGRHASIFGDIVPTNRLHVVPNFAQDELFASSDEIASKFRDTAFIRVLFLSNLLPGKGQDELISAVEQLSPAVRQRLQVDMAGGFESDVHKQAFLKRIATIPQVRYHGTVRGQAKRQLFRQAHLFCLPTYYPYEGQPISILEAYASGCAVITTDHSGILDVFEPGVNGLCVDKRSPASLAGALVRMVADPGFIARCATENRSRADREFRTGMYTDKLRGLMRQLTAET